MHKISLSLLFLSGTISAQPVQIPTALPAPGQKFQNRAVLEQSFSMLPKKEVILASTTPIPTPPPCGPDGNDYEPAHYPDKVNCWKWYGTGGYTVDCIIGPTSSMPAFYYANDGEGYMSTEPASVIITEYPAGGGCGIYGAGCNEVFDGDVMGTVYPYWTATGSCLGED